MPVDSGIRLLSCFSLSFFFLVEINSGLRFLFWELFGRSFIRRYYEIILSKYYLLYILYQQMYSVWNIWSERLKFKIFILLIHFLQLRYFYYVSKQVKSHVIVEDNRNKKKGDKTDLLYSVSTKELIVWFVDPRQWIHLEIIPTLP